MSSAILKVCQCMLRTGRVGFERGLIEFFLCDIDCASCFQSIGRYEPSA